MAWFHRVLNGLIVLSVLSVIVVTVLHGISGYDYQDLAWTLGYLIGYSLLIIAAGMIAVGIHAVATRSLKFTKWPFMLFSLMYIVLLVSRDVRPMLSLSNTFHIRVENRSGALLPDVHVFGRGDEVRFENLAAESSAVGIHRGREIDYSDRDSYSNRISVIWYDGMRWRERQIVDRYRVVGDSIVVIISSGDSVEVK